MGAIDYQTLIPNNVNLADDRRLQRALGRWQPNYLEWWNEMGPDGFQTKDIYLRTAISADRQGWAHFDYVRMPEYRWGIFLAEPDPNRKIHFGDHMGQDVWQTVPGEYRNVLRRVIVTQGDTEPASVEQQRQLGNTAPSLYDLRNLFQVNVEEGRHLWAMVYLLHSYFGREGRDEAEELLCRRSGDEDKPRILDAFNQPCDDWLSFFCFTMFADRDGKYQLASLAESAFDPLARTCRFMLTEEAHHLFVGDKGMERIIRRSAELTRLDPNGEARNQGGIDLPTIQRFINFWFSYCLDLFGSEISTNAADYFGHSLKGRFQEARRYDEHTALNQFKTFTVASAGKLTTEEAPLRNAMNEVLRDDYISDCQTAVRRWNKAIKKIGVDFEMALPNRRFHRRQGLYAEQNFDLEGNPITEAEFEANRDVWLRTDADLAYVRTLMKPCHEKGKIANWIAPPRNGVDGKPFEFEYVRLV
ncbi:MAG TPA: benzoyl-CoA 2,3-epoxidase subunit BoxB [Myxococcales bacterium]|nr:benzoyl-CoA 2,3-epoxidase subunit BoxB [Myxococcales bacterium]HAN32046.1 benzoyl-CoA 2,3-epoxidase subunit BoxB [Myxococcales bacterium]